MNFVEPRVEVIEDLPLPKLCELAYRTCYKSEHLMKEGSEALIRRLLDTEDSMTRHTSPLAHAKIRINIRQDLYEYMNRHLTRVALSGYKTYCSLEEYHKSYVLAANFRMLFNFISFHTLENDDGYKYTTHKPVADLSAFLHKEFPEVFFYELGHWTGNEATPYVEGCTDGMSWEKDKEYITFKITTTRDILQEIARHTSLALSVESTRYCNYDKKGMVFTFPYPYTFAKRLKENLASGFTPSTMIGRLQTLKQKVNAYGTGSTVDTERIAEQCINNCSTFEELYLLNCHLAECMYKRAIDLGARPEQARMLLPGSLKVEFLVSASEEDWWSFLHLRLPKEAHPQIRVLAYAINTWITSVCDADQFNNGNVKDIITLPEGSEIL